MKNALTAALTVGLATCLSGSARAQLAAELRASTSEYRYLDVNYTSASGLILDTLYIGVPGQNELYLGAGYTFTPASWLSLIPIAYGVLTPDTIEQAIERAGTKAGNKGGEAAVSAIEMVNLLREL